MCKEAISAAREATIPVRGLLLSSMHAAYLLCQPEDPSEWRAVLTLNLRLQAIATHVSDWAALSLCTGYSSALPEMVELLAAVHESGARGSLLDRVAEVSVSGFPSGPGFEAVQTGTEGSLCPEQRCPGAERLQVQLLQTTKHLADCCVQLTRDAHSSSPETPEGSSGTDALFSEALAVHVAIARCCRLLCAVIDEYGCQGLLTASPKPGSAAGAAAALVKVLYQSAAPALSDTHDVDAQHSRTLAQRNVEAFLPVLQAASAAAACSTETLGEMSDLLVWASLAICRCLPAEAAGFTGR